MEVYIVIETDSDGSCSVKAFDNETKAKEYYLNLKTELLEKFDNLPYEQYEEDEHHFEYVDYEEDVRYITRLKGVEVRHD